MRYPKLVRTAKTPVHICIESEHINAFGERETILDADFYCNWQDAAKTVFRKDNTAVTITGSAYIDGDIQPDAGHLTGGIVTIFGGKRDIAQIAKCRNPDGTVNYTRIDVL